MLATVLPAVVATVMVGTASPAGAERNSEEPVVGIVPGIVAGSLAPVRVHSYHKNEHSPVALPHRIDNVAW